MDREAEITKRIELLKKKNELLMQRHKEIEADRKSAEVTGRSLGARQPATEYSGNQGSQKKVQQGQSTNRRSRAHMDDMDSPNQNYPSGKHTPPSRGRGHNQSYRNSNTAEGQEYRSPGGNSQAPRQRGRGVAGRRSQDYEARRIENFRLVEEEMAQGPAAESPDNAAFGVSRFLDDPRRKGELEPDTRWKSTRHKGSYGGLEFDNIKREMRGRGRTGNYQERGRGRAMSRLQMSAAMTGRERQDQERWQVMRDAADREIMARSKNTDGKWRREWDAEKNNDSNSQDQRGHGPSDYGGERPRTYRGGRGRRRSSGSDRRGAHTGRRGNEGNYKMKEEQDHKEPVLAEAKEHIESTKDEDHQERHDKHAGDAKPQRNPKKQAPKEKKTVSPRHLAQQRAQTPSSKDGTEVWAQNSHHSDEAGQEWINGASRSAEQWLPSDEGNRNPAIDERMLEQQEDGATVYSRQLGRGWGDEKNIKATKAWVIDTEKAGTTLTDPSQVETERGRDGGRSFDKIQAARRNRKSRTETSRIKEEDDIDRLSMRSASPRLKRDNPGLTVEIRKNGGRRVKRYSEGDSEHVGLRTASIAGDKKDEDEGSPVTSPLAAGPMKTPEGMKYVENWAEEMDMLSPTYESRHKQLAVGGESFSLGVEEVASESAAPKSSDSEVSKPVCGAEEVHESDEALHSTVKAQPVPGRTSGDPYELPADSSKPEALNSTVKAHPVPGGNSGDPYELPAVSSKPEPAEPNVSEGCASEPATSLLTGVESSCGAGSSATEGTTGMDGEESGNDPGDGNREAAGDGFKDANDVEEEDEFYECDGEDTTEQIGQDVELHACGLEMSHPGTVSSDSIIGHHSVESSNPASEIGVQGTGIQSSVLSEGIQPVDVETSVVEDMPQTISASCQESAGAESTESVEKDDDLVEETTAGSSES